MRTLLAFDEDYLRLDPMAREYLTPLEDGSGYTLSLEKLDDNLAYYNAAIQDLRSILEKIPRRTRWAYEGLARLIVTARQFGFYHAHLSSEEIADLLRAGLAILAGEEIPDFGFSFLRAHAWDGRDVALAVEGGRRVLQ
jgi:hypothetical protein